MFVVFEGYITSLVGSQVALARIGQGHCVRALPAGQGHWVTITPSRPTLEEAAADRDALVEAMLAKVPVYQSGVPFPASAPPLSDASLANELFSLWTATPEDGAAGMLPIVARIHELFVPRA